MVNDFIHTAELQFLTFEGAEHPAAHVALLTFEYESDNSRDLDLAADVIALGYRNHGRREVKLYQWTTGFFRTAPLLLPSPGPRSYVEQLHFLTRNVLLLVRPESIDLIVGIGEQGPRVASLEFPPFGEGFSLGVIRVRTASDAACDPEGQEGRHSEPGVFTVAFTGTLREMMPKSRPQPSQPRPVRFIALTIHSSGILVYKDADYDYRKTLPALQDGNVPVIPWLQWSHKAVHVIDVAPHTLRHTQLGLFGSRVLFVTSSSAESSISHPRRFVLYGFRRGRPPVPGAALVAQREDGSDEPGGISVDEQEWTRSDNEDEPLPESSSPLLAVQRPVMSFTRIIHAFPSDAAATTPELDSAQHPHLKVDDVVFNDKWRGPEELVLCGLNIA